MQDYQHRSRLPKELMTLIRDVDFNAAKLIIASFVIEVVKLRGCFISIVNQDIGQESHFYDQSFGHSADAFQHLMSYYILSTSAMFSANSLSSWSNIYV